MIEHKKFEFYHLEKTGGTFMIWLLISLGIKVKILNGHAFYVSRKKNKNKIKIGMIRNPYDFYLSLWAYGCQKKGNVYKRHIKLYPDEKYLYQDPFNYNNFKKWLQRILIYNQEKPLRVKQFNLTKMDQYQIGLMTVEVIDTYFQRKYDILDEKEISDDFDYFIKLEEWTTILPKIIKRLELENEVKKSVYNTILNKPEKFPKKNQSNHDHPDKYYDQELLELVYQKDKFIFDKFNYVKKNETELKEK